MVWAAWFRADGVVVMTTGKVIRYDVYRGYGFATPAHGGEDVFIHVNDFEFDSGRVDIGTLVEFNVEQSDRGPKASHIRLIEEPVSTPAPEVLSAGPAPVDDTLCDVLRAKEFRTEVTEALLSAAPSLTSEQILSIRQNLVKLAHSHSWIES